VLPPVSLIVYSHSPRMSKSAWGRSLQEAGIKQEKQAGPVESA